MGAYSRMSYFSGCVRFLVLFYFICALTDGSNGLECKTDKFTNLFAPRSCPGMFDEQQKTFCCEGGNNLIYCCDFDEYASNKGAEYLIPVISGIAVGILAGCFICCLCCPCCMLYKRRHQGTVYGRVQQPTTITGVTHVASPAALPPQGNAYMPNTMPMPMPMPMQQSQPGPGPVPVQGMPYPGYPVTADYSGQPLAPPPYSSVLNEGYGKQAPYNPNFSNN